MAEAGISQDFIRGHIDTIVLRILCEGDNYGYEIMKAVSKSSYGKYELKESSLYTSLKRLQLQNLIEVYLGEESQGETQILPYHFFRQRNVCSEP